MGDSLAVAGEDDALVVRAAVHASAPVCRARAALHRSVGEW
jgi:hypothetical protein